MQISPENSMVALVEGWAAHAGWYDNKIDLHVDDLQSFATPDCTLTAHAPIYGTKPGAEKAVRLADVRKQLSRILTVGRFTRDHLHLALHPDGDALCLFTSVKMRVFFLPFTLRTIPLAFVVHAAETSNGLRIDDVHEWAAADPEAACRILLDHHDWPADTTLQPHVAFGATS